MPHCIVEYSTSIEQNVDVNLVIESVYAKAQASGLFNPTSIKTRAIPIAHYHLGSGNNGFVHVALKILAGRTAEQKQALSQAVLEGLASCFTQGVDLSVEVIDMDTPSYAKQVL